MEKVLCVGELLIDFFCTDTHQGLAEGQNFLKKAGGAPANVAAAISKLGGRAAFAGKVGKDPFGDFLENILHKEGVDTQLLVKDPDYATTLAFVSIMAEGERDFVFNRGADAQLTLTELPRATVKQAGIIHFGSATALLGHKLGKTYFSLMDLAYENDIFCSFDPNYRSDLWKGNLKEFVYTSRDCLARADFVKLSEEEAMLIGEAAELEVATKKIMENTKGFVAITQGKKGTMLGFNGELYQVPSIPVTPVDTTGAGDAFVGGVLYQIACQKGKPPINLAAAKEMVFFGNVVGALTCTQYGAIAALPTMAKVSAYLPEA